MEFGSDAVALASAPRPMPCAFLRKGDVGDTHLSFWWEPHVTRERRCRNESWKPPNTIAPHTRTADPILPLFEAALPDPADRAAFVNLTNDAGHTALMACVAPRSRVRVGSL